MLIKKPSDILSSEITPKATFLNRRKFLAGTAMAGAAAAIGGLGLGELIEPSLVAQAQGQGKIDGIQKSGLSTSEKLTPFKDVTNYNNYYEFSTDKYEVAGLSKDFKPRPWKVTIDGLVTKKQVLDVDDVIKMATPEERIYRHRCVEGWSIVVPWVGFSLSELIKRAQPLGKAQYVQFTSLLEIAQQYLEDNRGRIRQDGAARTDAGVDAQQFHAISKQTGYILEYFARKSPDKIATTPLAQLIDFPAETSYPCLNRLET